MFARIDPAIGDAANNACYASEMTPEQWALEQALARCSPPTRDDRRRWERRPRVPGHGCGGSRSDRSTSASECSTATTSTPRSTGSAATKAIPISPGGWSCIGVYHPDEPGAYAKGMIQAFVRTDVVAAGLLAFGQHVELQWHLPRPYVERENVDEEALDDLGRRAPARGRVRDPAVDHVVRPGGGREAGVVRRRPWLEDGVYDWDANGDRTRAAPGVDALLRSDGHLGLVAPGCRALRGAAAHRGRR